MIRMIQSKSVQQAKSYFSEALLKADYYLNDQELKGMFHGKLTHRLGLEKQVDKKQFHALCENRDPKHGSPITPKTKDERTVGYDISFHCPKSVSLVHALSKDDHILKAFDNSVQKTMQAIEADALTRVRKGGQYHDRKTGELCWATFLHQTSRPVDNHAPDPHLHAHCYSFNMTFDKTEQQYKATQFREIKRDMPYYQALFHKHLSDNLMNLGYQIRRADKSFEIDGIPKEAVALFSKRTDHIGRIAKEKGITDAKELAELGAKTRAKKQTGMSMDELRTKWKEQIKEAKLDDEKFNNNIIRSNKKILNLDKEQTAEQCLEHALSHSLERLSVAPTRRIQQVALQHSIGTKNTTPEAIQHHINTDERLIKIKDGFQELCTTRQVLQEEREMVQLAMDGNNTCKPLYENAPDLPKLKEQQQRAVEHVLTTSSMVSIVRGAAGSGKTTLMKTAVEKINDAGKQVMVIAPTSDAAHGVLKEQEGFQQAETVARFLIDKKLQDNLYQQVLWVDEAGMLGTNDMKHILQIVKDQQARVILGGDTRQHASVVRGDALRIINKIGKIQTAEVNKIYRQKNIDYRKAVEYLAEGNIGKGFEQLDTMQAIKSIDPLNPNKELVEDYIKAVKEKKNALIISPTHQQGNEVTQAIREALRKEKLLGKKEIITRKLHNYNFTEAQKKDWRNYREGQWVQFNQHLKGIKRGSIWKVEKVSPHEVMIKDKNANSLSLSLKDAGQYDVLHSSEIAIAKGDKIRITRNGFDAHKTELRNGQVMDVIMVYKDKVKLRNHAGKTNYTLPKNFGHISHAHCITSYAAQGKTVDEVLITQPANTFPATDAKQFYVSVSRAKEKVTIYTDDKEALLQHASEMGDRLTAMELVNDKPEHKDYVLMQERNKEQKAEKQIDRDADMQRNRNQETITISKEKDREPE